MSPVRISFVEDDAATRASWRSWLKASSEFVCSVEFGSAEEALLGWTNETADVAIIDLLLPDMGGAECLHRLKCRFPKLNCLVLTVVNDSSKIFDALKAGADGYLLKSATRAEVLEGLREVQRGGAPMSPAIARKVLQFFHALGKKESAAPSLKLLTSREFEVLHRISRGATNKEIADELGVGEEAIKARCRKIYEKLKVANRAEASAHFEKLGAADPTP